MRLGSLFLGCLLTAIGLACTGEPQPPTEAPEPKTYTVRGVVRQVRELPDGRSQLSVHHEEIADFVSINGEVIGMKSMTMPFSVAESVDLTGVQAGSKISFALSVDWSRTEPALIESLEILTEEAVLELGPGT